MEIDHRFVVRTGNSSHVTGGRRGRLARLGVVGPTPSASARAPAGSTVVVATPGGYGRLMHDHTATLAVLAVLAEGFEESGADPLARHLHQTKRRHLGNLVSSAVASQTLGQPAQHQIPIGLKHHVDEVDDDDPADVTQPELTHDLVGSFQVVAGHGLLEVAPGAGELAGVDVDDGHRFGPIDHEGTARGQPHLAVETFGDLLVDAVRREHVESRAVRGREALQTGLQVGSHMRDVPLHGVPGLVALDDQLGEVFGEQVAHDLQREVGLAVQQRWTVALRLGFDVFPACLETFDVAGEFVLAGALGGGADDDASRVGDDLLEQGLQALTLGVWQLAGDAAGGAIRHVHQEPTSQTHLAAEACSLVSDRVLGDLDQDRLATAEDGLDLARLAVLVSHRRPVDLAGVEHGVATLADVDECGLHRRQYVLDPTQVDVADQRGLRLSRHIVLHENLVLEHGDLGELVALSHHHHSVHGFAARQELGLANDRSATPPGLAALPTTLLLRLQPGRARNRGDLVLGRPARTDPGHGVLRVVGVLGAVIARATPTATATRGALPGAVLGLGLLGLFGVALR